MFARFDSRHLLAAAALGGLMGCAASVSPWPGYVSNLVALRFGDSATDKLQNPDPKFRYLRVAMEGYPAAILVLGYLDDHPLGEIEVWYSANKEVIRTQNGRIVGTAGLPVDWRAVQFKSPPPAWTQVPSHPVVFERTRDETSGYRFGVVDQIELSPWQGLPALRLPQVPGIESAKSWHWFREAKVGGSGPALPTAWFAWGKHRGELNVVYSEQCLSADVCLTLLRWPVREGPL